MVSPLRIVSVWGRHVVEITFWRQCAVVPGRGRIVEAVVRGLCVIPGGRRIVETVIGMLCVVPGRGRVVPIINRFILQLLFLCSVAFVVLLLWKVIGHISNGFRLSCGGKRDCLRSRLLWRNRR